MPEKVEQLHCEHHSANMEMVGKSLGLFIPGQPIPFHSKVYGEL